MLWKFWKRRVEINIRLNSRFSINEAAATYQIPLKTGLPGIVIDDRSSGGIANRTDEGEISYTVVSVTSVGSSRKTFDTIIAKLNEIGVPEGSYIEIKKRGMSPVPIGDLEGLMLYCTHDGDKNKKSVDIDIVKIFNEFKSKLSHVGRVFGVNENLGTQRIKMFGLYVYGESYDEMASAFDEISLSLPDSYSVTRKKAPLEIIE